MIVKKQTGKQPTPKLKCLKCERELSATSDNYYTHKNKFVSSERYPLCKTCINVHIGDKESADYINNVMDVLEVLNLPFVPEAWESSKSDFNKGQGSYIKVICSLPQYSDMTFKNSVINKISTVPKRTDESLDEETRMFWRGFNDEDIKELEFNFADLTDGYESESLVQEMILKQIAITQLKANRASNTKEYTDLINTISKLMNDANIKPAQKNSTNQSEEIFGAWIKKIEDEEPVPEPLKEFKDVDKIGEYINKYFVNHFAKLFGLRDVKESAK